MQCKEPGCGNEVIQSKIGRSKLFCSKECREFFWNRVHADEKRTGARSDDHKMSDIDPITRMGTCSKCGLVKAYASGRNGGTRWRCSKRVLAQKSIGRFNRSEVGRLLKFRNRHGLTKAEAERVLAAKGGGCAICGDETAELVYDHCHASKRFRGWLCNSCNLGLGKFGDDPDRLEAAARYVRSAL